MASESAALVAAGAALAKLLTPGDTKIVYSLLATTAVAESRVMAFNPDGRYSTPDGRANSPRLTEELRDAAHALRAACYRPGAGTWFGAVLTVTAAGDVSAEYNYDDEPAWDSPLDPIAYVTDAKTFRRDAEHRPPWLAAQLAEGESRIAARDATSPRD
ncbi:hypothetical protein [Microbacterium galbinum]|uniref:Uncharacterized protein n=1 Tax=Microbacterium galbinum TaxID=2851646 RepID=A0ABY4ISB7_9MICO|nr:hypothetical protein [Microbacterium galbinum]UPL15691.1 hypothetical protein KV396_14915 [Microbacterium galbinum]